MNFKFVLEKLLTAFKDQDIRYALIGGFALGTWGITRATVDIDFLVNKDDMERVHKIMTDMGYELLYHTSNVSQYVSPLKLFGEIDFLHAFRKASLHMLKRAEERKIFNNLNIKVLKPEDLIGLKIQAMANDENRRNIELTDIEALMERFKDKMDWILIREYFRLFDFEKLLEELEKKYGIS
jgi:hypothetical protein